MATRVREKTARRQEQKDTRPRAVLKYARISSSKVRVVIDLIRGLPIAEAKAVLMGTPNGASEPVKKLLDSAIANAENNMNLNSDSLYVAEVYADQGPTLKRYRPRAQGRATRIRKRTSHITIVLGQAN